MREFEAVVLGAGPAGAASAIQLARRAHLVAMVRPDVPPAPALAESVPPSVGGLLDELGLRSALAGAGFEPNRGNTSWWAGEGGRNEEFPTGDPGFHACRRELEGRLARAAADMGVTVLSGTVARKATREGGQWRVRCEDGEGRTLDLAAPWIVDATGRSGLLARHYREPERSPATLALVRHYARKDGWPADVAPRGHTLIESYADGWAWTVPVSREQRCVTVMIDQARDDIAETQLTGLFEAELARTKHIGAVAAYSEPTGLVWACPAALHTSRRFSDEGLVLAGDAASFIDPLSSFGVKKALASGWLAGVAVHTALTDEGMASTALAFHDSREREVYLAYRRLSIPHFRDAAEHYRTAYWAERAEAAERATAGGDLPGESGDGDPDLAGLASALPVTREDAEAAFDAIRSRESLGVERGATLRTERRPAVRGNIIVSQDHLVTDLCPRGIRYVNNVDLVLLVRLAPSHDDVPELWSTYNSQAPPVPLPDFLTALSTAVASRMLELTPTSRIEPSNVH